MSPNGNRTLWMWVAVAWVVATLLPSVAAAQTPTVVADSVKLTFAGSTTVQPLIAKLATVFEQKYPGIALDIAAGGSEVGLQAIHDATVDIGMVSRKLKPDEETGLAVYPIAMDAISIVVSPDNPLTGLTLAQLADIYLGRTANWNPLGGPDLAIRPVVREKTSGTRTAFDSLVLGGKEPAAKAQMAAMTAGDAAAMVAQTRGAIGYVGFGNLDARLKLLTVNNVFPTQDTVGSGAYPLTRPLTLLTGPLSQPAADVFVAWVLSDDGQAAVEKDGWVKAAATPAVTATVTITAPASTGG